MLEGINSFFQTFNVINEVFCMIVVIVFLAMIYLMKPERTYMMKHCIAGMVGAFFASLAHIVFLCGIIHINIHGSRFGAFAIYVFYYLYAILYIIQLNLTFVYINQLAYVRRSQKRQMNYMCLALNLIYMVILSTPVINGTLLDFDSGTYSVASGSNAYIYCSLICVVVCTAALFANKKYISRIVYKGCMFFIPTIAIVILLQFEFWTAYFLATTYTMPFVIFYVLFHSNRFDEIIGCQSYEAENKLLKEYIRDKKHFILFTAEFPKLANCNQKEIAEEMVAIASTTCRQIEDLSPDLRIYRLNSFSYHILCPFKTEKEFEILKRFLVEIATVMVSDIDNALNSSIHMVIARDYPQINDADDLLTMIKRKKNSFISADETEALYITEKDVVEFEKAAIIEKNLLDIAATGDINDERVQVYIQPIYDISKDTFRTGESLMRMKIDDKLYFPNDFIPVAEEIGAIHMLTKIMLHKVALKTLDLSGHGDFTAITVNVSTMELINSNASKEFYDIITEVGANPRNIRLEITESTTISDYNRVLDNMQYLTDRGIAFYLDDFGTGYSNLDRIATLPLKTIKFDKSLLYKALADSKSAELFVLMLDYFKKVGLKTVIEGVEDSEQKEYVEKLGFDYIQGYFYSKPVPAENINTFYDK